MSKQLDIKAIINWVIGFIIVILALGFIAGFLTSVSDYLLCWINNGTFCKRENFFQRFGFYSVYYSFSTFVSGFFIIVIAIILARQKYNITDLKLSIVGAIIGGLFAWFTKHLIWSIYIQHEKEIRYVVVVFLTMCLFPLVIKKFNRFFISNSH